MVTLRSQDGVSKDKGIDTEVPMEERMSRMEEMMADLQKSTRESQNSTARQFAELMAALNRSRNDELCDDRSPLDRYSPSSQKVKGSRFDHFERSGVDRRFGGGQFHEGDRQTYGSSAELLDLRFREYLMRRNDDDDETDWWYRSEKENPEDQVLNGEELVETEVETKASGIEDQAVEHEANSKMISAIVKEESIPQFLMVTEQHPRQGNVFESEADLLEEIIQQDENSERHSVLQSENFQPFHQNQVFEELEVVESKSSTNLMLGSMLKRHHKRQQVRKLRLSPTPWLFKFKQKLIRLKLRDKEFHNAMPLEAAVPIYLMVEYLNQFSSKVDIDKGHSSSSLRANQIWDPGGKISLQLKLHVNSQGSKSTLQRKTEVCSEVCFYVNLEVKVFQRREICYR